MHEIDFVQWGGAKSTLSFEFEWISHFIVRDQYKEDIRLDSYFTEVIIMTGTQTVTLWHVWLINLIENEINLSLFNRISFLQYFPYHW